MEPDRETFQRRIRKSGLGSLLILSASALFAHDTWVLPAKPAVAAGSELSLDATSGMSFPALDFAIQPDRIAVARVRLAGKTAEIPRGASAPHALRLAVRSEGEGVACLWIESKPKSIDLKPDQVKEYLDEIGLADTIGKEWSAAAKNARWRELYAKHAKTFVAVGTVQGDLSWAEPAGMSLELVPETDPTRIAKTSEIAVRLLKEGRPFPDFPVGMVQAGEKAGVIRKTDSNGHVAFRAGRKGWVLLRATELRRSESPDFDWKSDFSTLTLWVE